MKPKVTWLLAVKDGMPYLPETLASIESQNYKNWEILAWDNGSTDGTIDELKKWIPSRLPGQLITGRPLSLGHSRAELVSLCETELCAIIDADDISLPERLELQVAFLASYPEVGVVGSQMYCMDSLGKVSEQLCIYPTCHDEIVWSLLARNSIGQPTVLFRRSVITQVGNYQEIPNVEDYDLWLRVAAAKYRLANLNSPLIKYRVHKRSTTQSAIQENRLLHAMNTCVIKNAPSLYGCTEDEARALREQSSTFAFKIFLKIGRHLQASQGIKFKDLTRTNSFVQSNKLLVSPKDIVTRLVLAALDKRKTELPLEVARITKSAILKLFPTLESDLIEHRWKAQLKQWLKAQQKRNIKIDPLIEFIGRKPPFNPFEWIEIGSYCVFERDLTIWISQQEGAEPNLVIEEAVSIGRNTYIGVYQPVTIGKNVMIGAYSYIISADHEFSSRNVPIYMQGYVGSPVVIEEDAWLGTHIVVLPGVTIGKGAIVGAGSIVTKSVPAYEIWAGNPAKFIKTRPQG